MQGGMGQSNPAMRGGGYQPNYSGIGRFFGAPAQAPQPMGNSQNFGGMMGAFGGLGGFNPQMPNSMAQRSQFDAFNNLSGFGGGAGDPMASRGMAKPGVASPGQFVNPLANSPMFGGTPESRMGMFPPPPSVNQLANSPMFGGSPESRMNIGPPPRVDPPFMPAGPDSYGFTGNPTQISNPRMMDTGGMLPGNPAARPNSQPTNYFYGQGQRFGSLTDALSSIAQSHPELAGQRVNLRDQQRFPELFQNGNYIGPNPASTLQRDPTSAMRSPGATRRLKRSSAALSGRAG